MQFVVSKYFSCINASLKHESNFALQGENHVNILYDILLQSNKTNLTPAVLQFTQLHFMLFVYFKIVKTVPAVCSYQ